MKTLLTLAALFVASVAFAHPPAPSGTRVTVELAAPRPQVQYQVLPATAPQPVFVQQAAPAPVYLQAPAPVYLQAPAPVLLAAPVAAPVYLAPAPRRFPTPIRDFFFGR